MNHTFMLFFSLVSTTLFFHTSHTTEIERDAQKYQLYLWANYNQLENRSGTAQKCYELLFKEHNSSHYYPGFLLHLMQTQQFDAIVRLIPTLEANGVKDPSIELIIVNALQAVGNHVQAGERLVMLSKQYPDRPDIIYFAATVHAENNRFDKALECVDSYLKNAANSSKNFIFHYLKAQIFSRIGKNSEALVHVKKSLELSPDFDQGWLLMGLLHELEGNLNEAVNDYKTCLKIVGPNPMIERQILHIQLKNQQLLNYTDKNRPFAEALNAYNQHQYQKALHIVTTTTTLSDHIPSKLLTIELLCKLNNVDEALTRLMQWAQTDDTNDTWYRALHLLHKAGVSSDTILQRLTQLEAKNNKNILPLLYKADIYLKKNEKRSALDYLNKALKLAQQPLLRTKILFQKALLYYHNQEWPTMHTTLLEAQKLNQPFPPLLNLLAYYYATKGNNLIEAEQLILKALQQEKNPHFLDTYALILYKQKRIDEAHNLLTKLYQEIPQDSTVLFHLAKTMKQKGLHQQAHLHLKQAFNHCSLTHEKSKYQKCLNKWPIK